MFEVEFRQNRRKFLDKNAIAIISKHIEKFYPVFRAEIVAGNLNGDLAIATARIEPTDLLDEFAEVEVNLGMLGILFFAHSLQGNVQAIQTGLDHAHQQVLRKH